MNDAFDSWGVVERAVELARAGESFALATVVWRQSPSSGQHGSRALVTATGELHGWIGGACAEPVFVREAQRVIESGEPRLLWLGVPEEFGEAPEGVTSIAISCQSDGALQIYVEPVLSTQHVVVVGRSPMAVTLARLAEALDWRVDLVDGPDFTSCKVGASTAVVVATQGHGDEEALAMAVTNDPVYVGLIASRRRGEAVLHYLADHGVPADLIRRIHVPAGLDLGHTTHREVAVAVLAELVQLRAAGALRRSPVAGAERPADVVDPVCGMTVAATPANRPFEHDRRTYWFCCAGCHDRFAADPAAFIPREAPC